MKTTIEIPDELFKRAKATAATRGESLKELIREALEMRLAAVLPMHANRSGWRSVFGLAEPKSVDAVDQIVAGEFEQVDPSEWC